MSGKTKGNDGATAVHASDGSNHLVGIGNLRVLITNDDGSWFAQGMEIDYAAEGTSLEDVKKRFGDGLYCTIKEHLKMHGTIQKLLQPAPGEVWAEFVQAVESGKIIKRYSQVGFHNNLLIEGIEFFEQAA